MVQYIHTYIIHTYTHTLHRLNTITRVAINIIIVACTPCLYAYMHKRITTDGHIDQPTDLHLSLIHI